MSSTAESIDIEARLQSEIIERLMRRFPQAIPGADEDLLETLDSLQLLRLTVEAESLFGIRIANSELTEANIGTLHRLAHFIHGKMGHNGVHA